MFSGETHHLVEFLAAVGRHDDVAGATATAAELAAEEFDAEVGAVVLGDDVVAAVGFGAAPVPAGLAHARGGPVDVPGVGPCHVASAGWNEGEPGRLLVARTTGEFSAAERNLLLGMAGGLGLSLRMIGALEAERTLRETLEQRRRLLEVLLGIQRGISLRAPLNDVLAAVTEGASQLVGGRPVSLLLDDPREPGRPIVAATAGGAPARAGGPTIEVPVHVGERTAGALVAAAGPDVSFAEGDRTMLAAFAQHASLALTDAQTVEAMEQAYRDPVTALPNRALFRDRLDQALALAARRDEEVAVLFLDLDRFKAVNDSIGHAAGDELLRLAAERIVSCIRESDTAARFGGDEFAVLLQHPGAADDAPTVAERIIATIRQPFTVQGRTVAVGATIGIARSAGAEDADGVLRDADLAMYQGKRAGRGRWASFEPSMRSALEDRIALEADLQTALADGELGLHYQPLFDLAGGAVVGVEALLRWTHPRRGAVAPGTFIPVAEELGLMPEIGTWALHEACGQLRTWRARHPALTLTINLTSDQLCAPALPGLLAGALAATGLPGDALVLDVAEAALVGDTADTERALLAVKELGVAVAIDDFGTGYSALGHLQRLPVDLLKVDRAFVAALDGDEALVRTILDLGRAVGVRTVAEGIERPEQVEHLRAMGCDLGQGFHLGRPADAATLTAELLG